MLTFAGFTKKRALLYNLLAGVAGIIGTIIGLAIGTIDELTTAWILCFIAGYA